MPSSDWLVPLRHPDRPRSYHEKTSDPEVQQSNPSELCVFMCRILINHLQPGPDQGWRFSPQKGDKDSLRKKSNAEESKFFIPHGYEEALRWYRKGAEKENKDARVVLDEMFAGGLGVPRNSKKVMQWLDKAAEYSDANIQYEVAVCLEFGFGLYSSQEEGFKWSQKEAMQGYKGAQLKLAEMYDGKWGIPRNDQEAASWHKKASANWYKKAAENGSNPAQFRLGVKFEEGILFSQDYKEAFKWYRKAAEKNKRARFRLGVMYAKGLGVPQDYSRAHMWFGAADPDVKEAGKSRRLIETEMNSSQIAEAECLLGEWLYSRRALGYRDIIWCYEKAIGRGCKRAQFNMGLLHSQETAVPRNNVLAHMWFSLAGSDGNEISIKARDAIEKIMTPPKIAQAKDLARGWMMKNQK